MCWTSWLLIYRVKGVRVVSTANDSCREFRREAQINEKRTKMPCENEHEGERYDVSRIRGAEAGTSTLASACMGLYVAGVAPMRSSTRQPRIRDSHRKKKNDTGTSRARAEHEPSSRRRRGTKIPAMHSSHQRYNTRNEEPPLHYLTFARIMAVVARAFAAVLQMPSSLFDTGIVLGTFAPEFRCTTRNICQRCHLVTQAIFS